MARWRDNFEHDLKLLIRSITSFTEEEENFQLCLQFATSNLKYHRFLDVDSHKVSRSIERICEKFHVHSQLEKAKCFEDLCSKFLKCPFVKDGNTDTDSHYSLLQLLLILAENPTGKDYSKPVCEPTPESEPGFNWGEYLLEGIDVYRGSYADSVSDSESDSDGDHTFEDNAQTVVLASTSSRLIEESHQQPERTDVADERGAAWLSRNIVTQYWKGFDQPQTSFHSSSNLSRDWESYKSRTNPVYQRPPQTVITETQIIREVLWLLSGVKDSFVFNVEDNCIKIQERVTLAHISEDALQELLCEFIECATNVFQLQKFVEDVLSSYYEPTSSTNTCQTYQAFASSVSCFLQKFRWKISQTETTVIQQEVTMTLIDLKADLKAWMQKIGVVSYVNNKGVVGGKKLNENHQKSAHLIKVLYDTLLQYETLGEYVSDIVPILLPMWIETCKPYIDMIDNWITNGCLNDPYQEFIIQRNKDIKSLDETFWETSLTLSLCVDGTVEKKVPDFAFRESETTEKHTPVLAQFPPSFLQPILVQIILTGKSMEMLESLGRLSEVVGRKDDIFYKATPLYDIFLQSLENLLDKGTDISNNSQNVQQQVPKMEEIFEKQMQVRGVRDPFLKMNFQVVFEALFQRFKPTIMVNRDLSGLDASGLKPLPHILNHCLYPHIEKRYKIVCSKLVEILKNEYRLEGYLAAMRHFFLTEAGDTMFDFYRKIFDRIRLHEHWRDISTLNLFLQEALQENFPEDMERLSVFIEDVSIKNKDLIHATDCIKLHYRVPWPVDVVINSKSQEMYNQIFTFILQIKRAKYCLDELRFFDLEKEAISKPSQQDEESLGTNAGDIPRVAKIHRMQLLRMRLIYFVNSIHNYIMTRILHSTGIEFQNQLEAAVDLDEILSVHEDYISKIHERCLLHKRVSFLKEIISKVLHLILNFHNRWTHTVEEVSVRYIKDTEKEFSRCIEFLASFLNSAIKRGAFPHLESLAYALVTSTECLTY